ncbi:MAG: hypothetical protein WC054_00935 [Candidatus Nanopelagicales bacterium]
MSVLLVSSECPTCHKVDEFEVDQIGYNRWKHGAHIQEALSDLSVDRREQLMSGICPSCWDVAFPPEV